MNLESLARADPAAFRAALEAGLGDKLDAQEIEQLLADIGGGDIDGPEVRFVDAASLGGDAYGAYSAEGRGTIYLDRRLLTDQGRLEQVFAEEFGHHLDTLVGGVDAQGDEGALFSRTLYEGPLDSDNRSALRQEERGNELLLQAAEALQNR